MRKRLISSGSLHGRRSRTPITPFLAIAAISATCREVHGALGEAAEAGVSCTLACWLGLVACSSRIGRVWLAKSGDGGVAPPCQRACAVFVGAPCSRHFSPRHTNYRFDCYRPLEL